MEQPKCYVVRFPAGLGPCLATVLYSLSALCACFPPRRRGRVMIGWYPNWHTAVAWLVVTAMASVIYFGSMTRVIDFGN